MKNETVRESTKGQYKDIIATVIGGIPDDLTFDEATNLIGAKGDLVSRITEAIYLCAGRNTRPVEKINRTPTSQTILRKIGEADLAPCSGKRTIVGAREVFSVYLDSSFKKIKANCATPAVKAEIHEMQENATFAQIFNSLGRDLNSLVFTQDQIIEFCTNYRNKLRQDAYGTFFLLKEGDQFFVAFVDVDGGGRLEVGLYGLEYDFVWGGGARHRVVIPQLL